MRSVVGHTAAVFGRAMVMPNLVPPVLEAADALAYRARIMEAVDAEAGFDPQMTLYLAPSTTPAHIDAAVDCGIRAVKLYPAGATTNSDAGVVSLEGVYPALERMAARDLPLLIHGESTDPSVDVFDRERVFIEQTLGPLLERFPNLRVVLEHITTRDAVEFIRGASSRTAATITAHHLLMNRNAIFEGGIRPHHYCLPILKREGDREALVAAATGGDPSFFLGTDSAPHARHTKEAPCGCAGIYSAPVAIESYAEVFAEEDALERLEGFASHHGADFYRLPRNEERILLLREDWQGPESEGEGPEGVEVFWAGRTFRYRFEGFVR